MFSLLLPFGKFIFCDGLWRQLIFSTDANAEKLPKKVFSSRGITRSTGVVAQMLLLLSLLKHKFLLLPPTQTHSCWFILSSDHHSGENLGNYTCTIVTVLKKALANNSTSVKSSPFFVWLMNNELILEVNICDQLDIWNTHF